jgi:hypothetical protein
MVEHRNHLGILTPGYPGPGADIVCGGLVLDWNFTTSDSYKPPFRSGQKKVEVAPDIYAMFAGNGEQVLSVASISSPDLTQWRSHQNSIGYKKGDFNMDVITNSVDETRWKTNQNRTSGVNFY